MRRNRIIAEWPKRETPKEANMVQRNLKPKQCQQGFIR